MALVVGDVADPYFSAIAAGVTQAAEAAGLVVTMAVAGRSPQRELELVRTLRGQRPRVIVLAGTRIDGTTASAAPKDGRAVDGAAASAAPGDGRAVGGTDTRGALVGELEEYQAAGGRVVMVSQRDLPFDTVTIDNAGGAHRLARALAGAGYRRFAVFRAPESVRTSRDRVAGFTAGLRAAGITLDDRFVIETEFTRGGGYEAARKLAERGAGEVEIVFAVSDVMAIGAMTAFRDAGLVPGEDIAVAGFDDIDSAIDVTPALTSVAVPLREVGPGGHAARARRRSRPGRRTDLHACGPAGEYARTALTGSPAVAYLVSTLAGGGWDAGSAVVDLGRGGLWHGGGTTRKRKICGNM